MKIGVFILIFIVVLAAVIFFIQTVGNGVECKSDSDCIASSCCHPDSCVAKDKAPKCDMFCTEECRPGTMDCNQGSCICQNGKCSAQMSPQ